MLLFGIFCTIWVFWAFYAALLRIRFVVIYALFRVKYVLLKTCLCKKIVFLHAWSLPWNGRYVIFIFAWSGMLSLPGHGRACHLLPLHERACCLYLCMGGYVAFPLAWTGRSCQLYLGTFGNVALIMAWAGQWYLPLHWRACHLYLGMDGHVAFTLACAGLLFFTLALAGMLSLPLHGQSSRLYLGMVGLAMLAWLGMLSLLWLVGVCCLYLSIGWPVVFTLAWSGMTSLAWHVRACHLYLGMGGHVVFFLALADMSSLPWHGRACRRAPRRSAWREYSLAPTWKTQFENIFFLERSISNFKNSFYGNELLFWTLNKLLRQS